MEPLTSSHPLCARVFCWVQEKMDTGEDDKTACLIRMVVLIVGACAAVFALVAVTVYARQALRQALLVRILWVVDMPEQSS